MNSFAERYASLREAELHQLADQVEDLTPEAREALRAEFLRRHLSIKKINWKAQPPHPNTRKARRHIVGDAAGEDTEMGRGHYRASLHVWISFVLEIALLSVLLKRSIELLPVDLKVNLFIGIGLAALLATMIYHDRWRCIEAFSSRYCYGAINLSILYVPLIALLYANYRGLQKLRGR